MAKSRFKRADFIFKILLLIFFLVLLAEVRTYPPASRRLPQLIAMVTTALLLLSLASDFFKKNLEGEDQKSSPEIRQIKRKRLLFSSITVISAIIASYLGGVLLGVPTAFVCLSLLFKGKGAFFKSVAISVVVTGIIYVVFGIFFGIPVLEGLLW